MNGKMLEIGDLIIYNPDINKIYPDKILRYLVNRKSNKEIFALYLGKKGPSSEMFFCYDATKINTHHSIFREGKKIFPVD